MKAAPALELGIASGTPGSTVLLPLVIRGGSNVVAAQVEVRYASASLAAEAAVLGANLDSFTVSSYGVRAGVQRLVFYSRRGVTLPDPAQLDIPFAISENASAGSSPISLTNVILSDQAARAVAPNATVAGAISVAAASGARFQSILLSSGGVLQLQFTGTADRSYLLQTSPDLRAWSAWSTNAAVGGVIKLTDRVKPGQLFYRAALVP